MKQFLLLVKGGKGLRFHKHISEEGRSYLSTWKEWVRLLKKSGCLISGSPLILGGKAVYYSGNTEEVPNNYEMPSEAIIGFCVVEVKDEEKAFSILNACPFLEDEFTSCELREFRSMG